MPRAQHWAINAAEELVVSHNVDVRDSVPDVVLEFAGVIASHAPFKDGVAYMPVPRCDGCRHWMRGSMNDWGRCLCPADSTGLTHSARMRAVDDRRLIADLETAADFGCVQWEAK